MVQGLAATSACASCSAAAVKCLSRTPVSPATRLCAARCLPKRPYLRRRRLLQSKSTRTMSAAASDTQTGEHILQGWFTKLCKDEGLPSTVPTLDFQGQAQTDSIGICKWICTHFDDAKYPDLGYKDHKDRQQADQLIRDCRAFSSAGLDLLSGSTGRSWGIGTGQSQGQWKTFEKTLQKFQKAIDQNGGPFLMGAEVSVADLIYMPFMERFAIAMPEFTPYDPTKACEGKIGQWLAEMRKLECCQKAAPDAKLFLKALKQERSLDFFDFSTYTAYQLHPHLQ